MEPVIVAKFSAAVAAGGAIMFILVKLLSGGTEEIEINEVIFSSPKSAGCNSNTEECNCENLQCFFKNVSRIERYLDEAKCTISLAMYMLTTRRLMEALLRAKRRGVRVRIITDGTMFRNSACLMRELKNSGRLAYINSILSSSNKIMLISSMWLQWFCCTLSGYLKRHRI